MDNQAVTCSKIPGKEFILVGVEKHLNLPNILFDEAIMDFDKEKGVSPEYLSRNQMDHLTYLKWKFAIFENEEDDKILQTNLICAACGHPVTKVLENIKIRGRHDYGFTNLGYPVILGCFRNAPGCINYGRISYGYSWFRGYAWQIQLCGNCHTQLGWKYMSEHDSFYALVFKMLREQESEKDKDKDRERES